MTDLVLDRADPHTALSHLALYGLAAIVEDTGADVRVSWTPHTRSRPVLTALALDEQQLGTLVRDHAARHTTPGDWVTRDTTLHGTDRGLMSPRLSTFGDQQTWQRVQHARHDVLDTLTTQRRMLDLRLIAALGEPAYWSHGQRGQLRQDDGASRWEMQPRNRGSEFVGTRLRELATTVAARDPATVATGLRGTTVHDEAGKDKTDSRTPTGLASPGPTDNALAWCALWGISQLPIAPRIPTGRRPGTATTTGHIGRNHREWFYTPVWHQSWRPSRLRTILASAHLRTAASHDLPLPDAERPAATAVTAAHQWLSARGIAGLTRFPIARFGSDNAPERRAMRGELLPIHT